jgi:ubiquinone/menaquinone biosynthesis C-methylase UbiE
MELSKAIKLIQHAAAKDKSVWADLGCGDGLFTKALSHLLMEGSLIYAVDKNKNALNKVEVKNGIALNKLVLNFSNDDLPFSNLSGILMANSFHFIKNKNAFIKKAFKCLNDEGYLLMVEYDTDVSNFWVPYPISFNRIEKFFNYYNCSTNKLNEMPSRFNGMIYSAIITR